jgi:hypothetical protein
MNYPYQRSNERDVEPKSDGTESDLQAGKSRGVCADGGDTQRSASGISIEDVQVAFVKKKQPTPSLKRIGHSLNKALYYSRLPNPDTSAGQGFRHEPSMVTVPLAN